MIGKGALCVDDLITFVLDEADEMLSQGFKEQTYDIFTTLPPTIQVCLFSATMAPEILDITSKFMRDPVMILVKKNELTLEGSSTLPLNKRGGNSRRCATFMKPSRSRKRSFIAILV